MFQSLLPRVKKRLVVGQNVDINGGFGRTTCKVVKIEPPCIYVELTVYTDLTLKVKNVLQMAGLTTIPATVLIPAPLRTGGRPLGTDRRRVKDRPYPSRPLVMVVFGSSWCNRLFTSITCERAAQLVAAHMQAPCTAGS